MKKLLCVLIFVCVACDDNSEQVEYLDTDTHSQQIRDVADWITGADDTETDTRSPECAAIEDPLVECYYVHGCEPEICDCNWDEYEAACY